MVSGPASGAVGRLKKKKKKKNIKEEEEDDEIAVLPISIADSDGLL